MIINHHLITWPCGCVVPFGHTVRSTWHIAYACPWCDATFSRPDLLHWFKEGEAIAPVVSPYRQVIMIEDEPPQIVEVVGVTLDGEPLVRDRHHGAKPRRLGVPSEDVEVLRN